VLLDCRGNRHSPLRISHIIPRQLLVFRSSRNVTGLHGNLALCHWRFAAKPSQCKSPEGERAGVRFKALTLLPQGNFSQPSRKPLLTLYQGKYPLIGLLITTGLTIMIVTALTMSDLHMPPTKAPPPKVFHDGPLHLSPFSDILYFLSPQ
jgi:hypothetical protein